MPIPTCNWAQRKDKLYVTIDVQDVVDAKTNLDNVDGSGKLTFSGKSGDVQYELDLALMKEIDVAASQVSVSPRCIFLVIVKTEESFGHWPRLAKESGRHITQHIKCDWNKWVDEDEEDETPDKTDMSQYNFNGFGGEGGPGGMGGMGGMPGMGGMGGMAGMPGMEGLMQGMGGMGGMQGMEGMMGGMGGEDEEDSDNEEDEEEEDLPDLVK